MGREIRRVPRGFEHPRDDRGHYKPMFDEAFEIAVAAWKAAYRDWENGTHESLLRNPDLKEDTEYWEWEGCPPDRNYHRPPWTEEPTCYQIYETVTEGTPVSPVFETEDEMVQWLRDQGHSEHAAREFVRLGSCCSAMVLPKPGGGVEVAMGIDAFDLLPEQTGD